MLKHVFHISCCILLLSTGTVFAQSETAVTDEEDALVLPPLAVLIDSAVKRNGMVNYRIWETKIKEAAKVSSQNFWYRNLGVQADTRYGTYDNFLTNNNGTTSSLVASRSQQFNYGVGAFIKIPLGDIIDRKNQIKKADNEIEQAKSAVVSQEEQIRQIVIKQYNDLLLRQRLLKIRAVTYSNARVNMDMVEKEFRNGVIPVLEYARVSEIVSRAAIDFETAKSEYVTAKMLLEDMTGCQFMPVKKK